MSTKVGSIYFDLFLQKGAFDQQLSEVNKAVSKFGDNLSHHATKGSQIFATSLAAIGTAAMGVATKATLTAARTETLGVAMNTVAKATQTSSDVLSKQEAILKKQGITTQEARATLIKFMQSQLDVADASKIARVAQDLAVIAGENSSETTAKLTEAIANQNVLMLRQFGIVASSTDIFDEYAKTLGKTGSELTDIEKKQAFVNKILTEGGKVTGAYEASMETVGKKMSSLARHFEEAFNAIGEQFLPILGVAVDALTEALKIINPENIEKTLNFLKEAFPIITGAIMGGLVPAMIALGKAIAVNMIIPLIALLPYIAVGALIGAAIWALIKLFENWGTIMDTIGAVIETVTGFVTDLFKSLGETIASVVETIIEVIDTLTAPFQWLYYNLIEPILLLIEAIFLRVFYEAFNFVSDILTKLTNFIQNTFLNPIKNFFTSIFNSIASFIQGVWNKIYGYIANPINNAKNAVSNSINGVWNFIRNTFNSIVSFLLSIGGRIINAIYEPFRKAKELIEDIANKIREAANNINPFSKHSPSLVENVIKGIDIIKSQYESLGNLSIPPITSQIMPAMASSSEINQDININIDRVNDMQDVEAIGRELGFKASLLP
jgi:phage-related protein